MPEFVLVLFFEEIDNKLAGPEHFGLHYGKQELLVVELLFDKLLLREFFLLVDQGQRRNQGLWILAYQVVSECHKVNIQSLHFPVKWICLDNNHERLATNEACKLAGDQLVHVSHVDLSVRLLVQHRQLGLARAHGAEGVGADDTAD